MTESSVAYSDTQVPSEELHVSLSFLGSSWPLILQDPFVPGAQRSQSSLKAHSRMCKPSSFTLPNLQDTAAKLLCLFRVNSL